MATPIIYTGQGITAPRDQGRAFQALSQFTQHQQSRTAYEIEAARKDRDKLAELMKMDVPYATSMKLQQRMGEVLDNFTTTMTDFNKKRSGNLTAQDLIYLNQQRGQTQALLGRLNAIDKEMMNSYKLVTEHPEAYSVEMFKDSMDYVNREGDRPPNGFLFPAFKSLQQLFSANTEREQSFGTQWVKEGGENVAYKVPVDSEEVNPDTRAERALIAFRNNEVVSKGQKGGVAYHAINEFDNLPESEQKQYANDAQRLGLRSPVEAYVVKVAQNTLWRQGTSSPWRLAWRDRGGAPPLINIQNGMLSVDGKPAASLQRNVPVVDTKLNNAVVFNPKQSKLYITPIPTYLLDLPEGVEAKDNTVYGVAHAADRDKTYWVVDKGSLDKVWFTESAVEALGGKGKFTYDETTKKWTIKEGFENKVVLPTNTSDTQSLIENWTLGGFGRLLNELPENPKGQVDLMEIE